MSPPPPVADRTVTLAPRESSTPAPPAVKAVIPEDTDDPERYELVGEHARGGLGRVVRAVDKRLGRTVAVKELLRHNDSNEARFMREALITARLQHPGIVPVHEAGRWPSGDPYYVMKLVEGRTLKELIAERTTIRERLGLLPHVIAVADAVGYAHSEGVIHRDVKPSNIIVGAFGETIVVDWGLARDCKRDIPELSVVGTPAYMSPEQARGELVNERADVYAIGAVLYELLAGSPPHVDTTPQATLDRVLAGPPLPLGVAVPQVPGELGTIVAKAMARDPDARYANATALAEDLRRYQTGKLVSAHSYSAWSLLRKKVAQHRGVVAVALASAIALGVVGVESFRRVVHERNIAQHERGRTEDALSQAEKRKRELVLLQAMTSLRKDPTATVAWLKTYDIADEDRAPIVNVVDEAIALGVARHVFRPGGEWALDAVFTPDGTRVVVAVRDGVIRAYDLRTGLATVLGTAPSAPEVIEISPDGTAAISAGTLGEVMLWPLAGGPPRTLLPSTGRMAMALRFSPDGTRLLVDRDRGMLDVVPLAGGEPSFLGAKGALKLVAADRDWSKQVVLTSPNAIAALEGTTQRPLGATTKMITHLEIAPAGDLVIVHDGSTVWSVPYAGGPMKKLATYSAKLLNVEWSPDAKTVALVGHSHDLVLVDLATGAVRALRGHTDALYTGQWTRDGTRFLSASDDATARVWNIGDGSSIVLRGHDDDIYRARFSADERQVATASFDGSVRVWQLDQVGSRSLIEGNPIESLFLDGDRAVVKTPTTVARWNIATGFREALFSWGEDQKSLGTGVPSRDGELLLVPGADWSMEIRRRTGAAVKLIGHKGAITRVDFSRDNKFLYTSSTDGTLRRWDTTTGAATLLIEGPMSVRGFALAADGRVAAQVGDEARMITPDGTTTLLGKGGKWCVAMAEFDRVRDRLLINRCDRSIGIVDGAEQIDLAGGYALNRIGVSKDGTRIAGAMGDRTVVIWDAATGQQISVLRGHTDLVMDVAFSPDGTQLASSSYDKTIRIWQLGTLRSRVLRGHSGAVDRVAWHDGTHLVTGARDGTLRLWDVPSMELPTVEELSGRLNAATSASIDLDRPTTLDGLGGSS
ncbi:MAG: protein kinase [Myxococcales bacterium]|nr:protein kinase [Myxococcales bacterium]